MNKKTISAKPRAAHPAPISPLGAAIQNGREITDEERGFMRSMDEAASKIRSMETDVLTAVKFLDVRKCGRFQVEVIDRIWDYADYRHNDNRASFDNFVGAVENYLERLASVFKSACLEISKARFEFCIYAECVAIRGYTTRDILSKIVDALSAILAANAATVKSYPTELDEFFETVRGELPRPLKKGAIRETIRDVWNDPKFGFVLAQYGHENGIVTLERHFRTWRSRKHPGEIRPKAKARKKRKE